jgi:hypothetical protein
MAYQDNLGNRGVDDNTVTIGAAGSNYTIFGGIGANGSCSPMDISAKITATSSPEMEEYTNLTMQGRKFDGGKLMYGLLPPLALEETVKVLTFGAQKYEPDNWQFVPDSKRRYFDALQRHLWAWKQGEQIDQESGLPHLAHAMCCLMFLYEHDVKYSKE